MPTYQIKAPDGQTYSIDGPEGASDAQVREQVLKQHPGADQKEPPAPPPETSLGSLAKQGAYGLGEGLIEGASAGVDLMSGRGISRPIANLVGAVTGQGRDMGDKAFGPSLSKQVHEALPDVVNPEKNPPRTTAEKFVRTPAEFAGNPMSWAGAGSVLAKAPAVLMSGVGSEAAGHLVAPGSSAEPWVRAAGAVAGGQVPRAAARAVTPLPANARHQGYVQTLENEGVTDLTAGQRTGSKSLQYVEEHLGGSPTAGVGAGRAMEMPKEQFTRAALQRVGENAERATPEVVDRAFTRIGNQFDTLAARNHAQFDPQYAQDIIRAQHEYDHLFVDPMRRPMVQNVVDHAFNKIVQSNTMTGAEYQAIRSRIERMRRGQHNDDPELSHFLADVRGSMDRLMERSIAANNPSDLGAWREARSQYRNMLVIEKATTGAETGGIITPAKLKQAVVQQSRRAYARGDGDFAELTRAGENVMPGLPQSGTAPRLLSQAGLIKLGTTGASGRALMSPPVQGYLGNQVAAPALQAMPDAGVTAARSLMASPLAAGGP